MGLVDSIESRRKKKVMRFISKNKNGWILHTIADGSLACDNDNISKEEFAVIEKTLLSEFENRMKKEHVNIDWDEWSGYIISRAFWEKKSQKSDELIEEIYEYLSR